MVLVGLSLIGCVQQNSDNAQKVVDDSQFGNITVFDQEFTKSSTHAKINLVNGTLEYHWKDNSIEVGFLGDMSKEELKKVGQFIANWETKDVGGERHI